MKVTLSVGERLLLLNVLPNTGSYVSAKVVSEARGMVGFNEDELLALEFVEQHDENGGMTVKWNQEAVANREFEFGEALTSIIVDSLKKLDSEEKITPQHIPLYEKFLRLEG